MTADPPDEAANLSIVAGATYGAGTTALLLGIAWEQPQRHVALQWAVVSAPAIVLTSYCAAGLIPLPAPGRVAQLYLMYIKGGLRLISSLSHGIIRSTIAGVRNTQHFLISSVGELSEEYRNMRVREGWSPMSQLLQLVGLFGTLPVAFFKVFGVAIHRISSAGNDALVSRCLHATGGYLWSAWNRIQGIYKRSKLLRHEIETCVSFALFPIACLWATVPVCHALIEATWDEQRDRLRDAEKRARDDQAARNRTSFENLRKELLIFYQQRFASFAAWVTHSKSDDEAHATRNQDMLSFNEYVCEELMEKEGERSLVVNGIVQRTYDGVVVVHGDPGSGKSRFSEMLARTQADGQSPIDARDTDRGRFCDIVIHVALSKLATTPYDQWTQERLVEILVASKQLRYETAAAVKAALRAGAKALWVLDGYDEVQENQKLTTSLTWFIRHLARDNQSVAPVITSRLTFFNGSLFMLNSKYPRHLELTPWDRNRRQRFVTVFVGHKFNRPGNRALDRKQVEEFINHHFAEDTTRLAFDGNPLVTHCLCEYWYHLSNLEQEPIAVPIVPIVEAMKYVLFRLAVRQVNDKQEILQDRDEWFAVLLRRFGTLALQTSSQPERLTVEADGDIQAYPGVVYSEPTDLAGRVRIQFTHQTLADFIAAAALAAYLGCGGSNACALPNEETLDVTLQRLLAAPNSAAVFAFLGAFLSVQRNEPSYNAALRYVGLAWCSASSAASTQEDEPAKTLLHRVCGAFTCFLAPHTELDSITVLSLLVVHDVEAVCDVPLPLQNELLRAAGRYACKPLLQLFHERKCDLHVALVEARRTESMDAVVAFCKEHGVELTREHKIRLMTVDDLRMEMRSEPALCSDDAIFLAQKQRRWDVLGLQLEKNTTLTQLDLKYNKVTASGVQHIAAALAKNISLKQLHLGGNQIGAAGAQHIAAALTKNIMLKRLGLGDNQIGEAGAQHIATALEKNITLTHLDLGNNQIGAAGAQHIATALEKNRTLSHLVLEGNEIGAAGAQHIATALESCTLAHMDLGGNWIGAAGAQHIATALDKNRTLTQLDLKYNQVFAAGAQHIATALENNITLTQLNLGNNQIGAAGAQHIATALEENRTLTQLHLEHNQIGAAGAQHIAAALEKNRTLTQLDLGGNEIGSAGAQHMAAALRINTALTQVDLMGNQINNAGAQHIAAVLDKNRTLTRLGLGGNNFRFDQIGDAGTRKIAAALAKNSILTQLDLDFSQIGDMGAQYIAAALRMNTTLTQLQLRGNEITVAGAQHIAAALGNNTTLTQLDLGNNEIGDAGVQHIAAALEKNRTLTLELRQTAAAHRRCAGGSKAPTQPRS